MDRPRAIGRVAFLSIRRAMRWLQDREKAECYLLNLLPIELILEITRHLPPQNCLLLARTCSPLRRALNNLQLKEARLSRRQHLEYLRCLAYDSDTMWACEECATLHPAVFTDTPIFPSEVSCPKGWRQLLNSSFGYSHYYLGHRHIQLTLKYHRAVKKKTKHQRYLEELMRPHHAAFISTPRPGDEVGITVETRYTVIPRVVDGRYLLFSLWTYSNDGGDVSPETIGSTLVCPHQNYKTDRYRWYTHGTSRDRPTQSRPQSDFMTSINTSFAGGGARKSGRCKRCLTEFAVKATPERATVSVWHDLGTEGSPTSDAFRVHAYTSLLDRVPLRNLEREFGHIHALYGVD